MKHPASRATRLASSIGVLTLVLAASGVYVASQTPAAKPAAVDREYILESTMLGYRGVGGDIDGVRNPTLWARTGESVRITIVNGELMVHDIALEGSTSRARRFSTRPPATNITFTATKSDIYYCSVPGHRRPGMEGRIEVSDEPRVPSEGVPPQANGRALNLDFETGTLDDWTATGDAFALVKGDVVPDRVPTSAAARPAPTGSAATPRGGARKGTLTSVPFRVSQPYASFLVSGGAFTSTRVELVLAPGTDQRSRRGASRSSTPSRAPTTRRCGRSSSTSRIYAGKDIFVRLVDDETGASTVAAYLKESPWAHITFDHFRFHDSKPVLPHRDHLVGDQHAAADRSDPARRPLGCRRGARR